MLRAASLTLVIGGVLLVTWVLNPASARPHRADPRDTQATAPQEVTPTSVAEVAADVAKLRERLAVPSPFAKPARDPFRFGHGAEPPPEVPAPIVVAPPPPPLPRLVAILSDTVNGAVVRRAALGGDSGVRIVSVGDMFGALRVSAITADGVELVDPATSATFRVPLR